MSESFRLISDENEFRRIFSNWNYDDKAIISRCFDLFNRIKEHMFSFGYESISEGIVKDLTFNDACLNLIVQIKRQLLHLSNDHLNTIRQTGIIVMPHLDSNTKAKGFIPFNDIVLNKMGKVFGSILGKYVYDDSELVGETKAITPIWGILIRENKNLRKLEKSLLSNSEDSGIVVLADSLSILDKVKTMNYHLQRLEIESLHEFKKSKAGIDAISYTLMEAIKLLEKSSTDTKDILRDKDIKIRTLLKPHILVNQKGLNKYHYIKESDYVESLWDQIAKINECVIVLSESFDKKKVIDDNIEWKR